MVNGILFLSIDKRASVIEMYLFADARANEGSSGSSERSNKETQAKQLPYDHQYPVDGA